MNEINLWRVLENGELAWPGWGGLKLEVLSHAQMLRREGVVAEDTEQQRAAFVLPPLGR